MTTAGRTGSPDRRRERSLPAAGGSRYRCAGSARPPGGGFAGTRARVTARNAAASIDKITWRYQAVQRRTWCSSSPASDLAIAKDSSMPHRRPATPISSARPAPRPSRAPSTTYAGSSQRMTSSAVPSGGAFHSRTGMAFPPSLLDRSGIDSPSPKSGLDSRSSAGTSSPFARVGLRWSDRRAPGR